MPVATDAIPLGVSVPLAPEIVGDWKVLKIKGGALRFNAKLQRLDAHCGQHGPTCKADRTLRKGPIGFLARWLDHTCETKQEHSDMKALISSAAWLPQRTAPRDAFKAACAEHKGFFDEVLQCERDARGSNDEPYSIPL